ncbi:MAG TPA: hypothetical protein VNO81_11870 [Candidatus Nitrosotenuis sp.]|jgi:uncharacterized protein affecting Mg2+/Co2+ transport|nr:hypothetical protein [Candidatus Nitrosotenuis sp.]
MARSLTVLLMTILATAWLASGARAAAQGMVTRVEGEEVVVNRGAQDQMIPGSRWYVYRMGRPVAQIEITLVDQYSSRARIVEGGGVQVGDQFNDRPFAQAPASAGETAAPPPAAPPGAGNPGLPPEAAGSPALDQESRQEIQESYERYLASRTATRTFAGGAQAKKDVQLNPWMLLNLAGSWGANGQWIASPQVLVATGAEAIGTNTITHDIYKDSKVDISVTWWDDGLVERYADQMALREGRFSVQDRLSMRASLFAQKGLDRFLAFSVTIKNHGPGSVQFAPFHWHIYLIDAQGNRLKAERYDQVLDKTLNPNQQVEGNVYFLRNDAAGRPVTGSGPVTLVLADIFGQQQDIRFGSK